MHPTSLGSIFREAANIESSIGSGKYSSLYAIICEQLAKLIWCQATTATSRKADIRSIFDKLVTDSASVQSRNGVYYSICVELLQWANCNIGRVIENIPKQLPELISLLDGWDKENTAYRLLDGSISNVVCVQRTDIYEHTLIKRDPFLLKIRVTLSDTLENMLGALTVEHVTKLKHSADVLKALAKVGVIEPNSIPNFDSEHSQLKKLIEDLEVTTQVKQWLITKKIIAKESTNDQSDDDSTATPADSQKWNSMTADALTRRAETLKAALNLPPQFYILWQKKSALFNECLRQMEKEQAVLLAFKYSFISYRYCRSGRWIR